MYGVLDGHRHVVANLSDRDITFGSDGRFEVTLTPEGAPADPHGTGSLLQSSIVLTPGADTLVVREYFLDRSTESASNFTIEAIDDPEPPPPLDSLTLTQRLQTARTWLSTIAGLTAYRATTMADHPMEPLEVTGGGPLAPLGTPDNNYVGVSFRLADHEALIIEGRAPDCRYWSAQLLNRWGESFDSRGRTVSLNSAQTEITDDGLFRYVVAATDPGVPNWLDTEGHRNGWALVRYMQADSFERPTFRLEPIDR